VGDENLDLNIPIGSGDWERVPTTDFKEYWSISGRARLHLKAVYRYVNSDNTILMYSGGSLDQPKIFWQIVDILDRMKNEYNIKDRAKNG